MKALDLIIKNLSKKVLKSHNCTEGQATLVAIEKVIKLCTARIVEVKAKIKEEEAILEDIKATGIEIVHAVTAEGVEVVDAKAEVKEEDKAPSFSLKDVKEAHKKKFPTVPKVCAESMFAKERESLKALPSKVAQLKAAVAKATKAFENKEDTIEGLLARFEKANQWISKQKEVIRNSKEFKAEVANFKAIEREVIAQDKFERAEKCYFISGRMQGDGKTAMETAKYINKVLDRMREIFGTHIRGTKIESEFLKLSKDLKRFKSYNLY